MSGYPIHIITNYREGKISRQQVCNAWAQLQGFDDTVKGFANNHGTFLTYRGRIATITNGILIWCENKKIHKAKTIKEMKIKVDYYEQEAQAKMLGEFKSRPFQKAEAVRNAEA